MRATTSPQGRNCVYQSTFTSTAPCPRICIDSYSHHGTCGFFLSSYIILAIMTLAQKALHALRSLHWNFFRIHLACFVFVPLVFSGIVYAGNAGATGLAEGSTSTGIQRSEYVDCLFLCYSAMT